MRFFDYFSIKKIIKSSFICLVILVPLNFYFYKEFFFPRSISILAPIIIAILIILHRVFINFLINLNTKSIKNNILVIGLNNQNASIIKNIRGNINSGTIKAVIDTSNLYKQREFNGIQIYKKKDLDKVIKSSNIDEIIVGENCLTNKEFLKLFNKYENSNIRIKKLNSNQSNSNKYLNSFPSYELNCFST